MRSYMYVTLFFLLASLFFACNDHHPEQERLLEAERLMDHAPDSALAVLRQIALPEKLPAGEYAWWCLLFTQAEDKTQPKHTSDSLIRVAIRWFEKERDPGNLPKAYYYGASVYHDLGDAPRAQEYYLKALETGKNSGNHALLGRIYANLGSLYLYQNLFDQALAFEKKAVEHFSAIKDTVNTGFTLRNIGRIYTKNSQLDSAALYYSRALKFVTEKNHCSIHNDIASLYKRSGDYPKAFEHIRLAASSAIPGRDITFIYYNLGDMYRLTGQYDSAYHYLSRCLDSPNLHTRSGANLSLGYLGEKQENWPACAAYLKQYLSLQDSINRMERSERLQHVQSLYDYGRVEKERFFHEMESQRKTNYIYLLAICFILLSIAGIFYYQRKKRIDREKQEKELRIHEQRYRQSRTYMEEKEEEIRQLKTAAEQETDQLKKELLVARRQAANRDIEQAKELSALQAKKLAEFKKSPLWSLLVSDDKLTPENWTELETWMDLIYPEMNQYLKKALPAMSDDKLKVCYLIKIGLPGKRISDLLCVSESAISKRKERLLTTLTGRKGKAADLDAFLHEIN